MNSKRHIKNYLLNYQLQINLSLKFLLAAFFSSLITGCVIYFSIYPLLSDFVPTQLVNMVNSKVLLRLFVYIIPCLIAIFVLCIILTHSIAGPIYNIEKNLEKIIEGKEDIKEFKLRKNDAFINIASKLNKLLPRLKKMPEL